MREQYKYQRAVAAELDRAMKKDDMLTTFGPVLHDPDGEVFWLNHNNRQFVDELLLLLERGAVLRAYMGFTTGRVVYLNVISTQEHCTKLRNHSPKSGRTLRLPDHRWTLSCVGP